MDVRCFADCEQKAQSSVHAPLFAFVIEHKLILFPQPRWRIAAVVARISGSSSGEDVRTARAVSREIDRSCSVDDMIFFIIVCFLSRIRGSYADISTADGRG